MAAPDPPKGHDEVQHHEDLSGDSPGAGPSTGQPATIDGGRRCRTVRCRLVRTVRFACPLAPTTLPPRNNTFAGWPSSDEIAVHGAFVVEVEGVPDRVTGYLVSVADIDDAVRRTALPDLSEAIVQNRTPPLAALLRAAIASLADALPCELVRCGLRFGPYFGIDIERTRMDQAILRQSFEFSAAHRLHCPQLDAESNRRTFGKCNNPNGHGHNYRLEVAVRVKVDADGHLGTGLHAIEESVRREVVDRFDHRHLNEDVDLFRGLNPSVEHIAIACRDLLTPALLEIGGELAWLTVWETEKTGCTIEGRLSP